MRNSREHRYVVFDTRTIRRAIEVFIEDAANRYGGDMKHEFGSMKVQSDLEGWQLDNIDELLAVLAEKVTTPQFVYGGFDLSVLVNGRYVETANLDFTQYANKALVAVKHADRAVIARVHEVFLNAAPGLYKPPLDEPIQSEPRPRIFIGHGGSNSAWAELKNHLTDKHQFEVVAYETGARAGHTIRDILEEMMGMASFAILVLSAEDEQADGSMHARQNVIHEAGLFQGRLGFARAIVVLQDGVENLSNLAGLQYVSFEHDIKETYGEILATLKREFG